MVFVGNGRGVDRCEAVEDGGTIDVFELALPGTLQGDVLLLPLRGVDLVIVPRRARPLPPCESTRSAGLARSKASAQGLLLTDTALFTSGLTSFPCRLSLLRSLIPLASPFFTAGLRKRPPVDESRLLRELCGSAAGIHEVSGSSSDVRVSPDFVEIMFRLPNTLLVLMWS